MLNKKTRPDCVGASAQKTHVVDIGMSADDLELNLYYISGLFSAFIHQYQTSET